MNELDDLLTDILGSTPDAAGQAPDGTLWRLLQEAELDRVGFDPEYGGAGGTLADAALIIVRTGESCLSVPITESVLLAGHLAGRCGHTLGSALPAIVFTLPGTPEADRLTLRPSGDGRVLSGNVRGVPWSRDAKALMVVADAGHGQAAVVELDPVLVPAEPADNIAGEARDDLRFVDVPVPAANVWYLPVPVIDDLQFLGALGRSCQLLGALRTTLALTVSYALLRNQFGRPIGSRQAVAGQLANLVDEVAATEAGVSAAIDRLGEPGDELSAQARLAIAAAKVQAARAATAVAAIAHQVHGAIGMTAEHPLHHATARLWAWRDEYGTEQAWARRLFAMATGGGDLWQSLTDQS